MITDEEYQLNRTFSLTAYRRIKGYHRVHAQLTRQCKPARNYRCACGDMAEEWAYDHQDPNELWTTDRKPRVYSRSLTHYAPMCVPCHRRLDASMRAGQKVG